MNIHNFANRYLCEYQSIFPNVACLLDHVLFTIGSGYEYDNRIGMIVDSSACRIDQFPFMSDLDWGKLIADCHAKERGFAEKFATHSPVDEIELAEDCAKYRRVLVNDSLFSAEALYEQLQDMSRAKQVEADKQNRYPFFVRPYPLSAGYSHVFSLDEKTPTWFLQIALNFSKAWVRFLNNEIETGNVWVRPSLRLAPTEKQIANAVAMGELFGMIRSDKGYDGWADNTKEPEVDYADLSWTTKHRDIIAGQMQRLTSLLK
jgi:hypothetical protein